MALSEDALTEVQAALDAVDEFYARRLEEIDRDVRNLREYGSPISKLGDKTTEKGVEEAVAILAGIGVSIT